MGGDLLAQLAAYQQAFAFLFQPYTLFVMFVGVVLSLIIGLIPGLNPLISVPLCLPFLLFIPKDIGLFFLIALQSTSMTAGSITAILINMPGTPVNAATLIDGFPMTVKGEANRAIGAAVMSSMIGGAVPVALCLVMIPLILKIVMAFRAPEMAMLVVMGLAFLAVLSGHSPIRGVCSGVLGILLATVGFDSVTGVNRFTFGSTYLFSGLDVPVVALGLFGLSEMLDMHIKGQLTITRAPIKLEGITGVVRGIKDVINYKWLWLRSTLIGYIIGMIPGIGAEVATFTAYGQAKLTSKNPEKFGTGYVEGVIAPESANNAKEAGALLTTMAFGIPGSSMMAIMMGAFLMVGITPGPKMMIDELPLALILLIGIAITNIVGGIICLFSAPYLSKVINVKNDYLFPLILSIMFVGAFSMSQDMGNVLVVIIFGIIGLLMKRYHFSRPAFILGFVLGGPAETYILRSIKIYGPLFFLSPISLVIIAITIFVFIYSILRERGRQQ